MSRPADPDERIGGFIYIGLSDDGDVVMNVGKVQFDSEGRGYFVFTAEQALYLAQNIVQVAERALRQKAGAETAERRNGGTVQ